jgi:hypothetical protein
VNGVNRKIQGKMVRIKQRAVGYEVTAIQGAVQFQWACNWGPAN